MDIESKKELQDSSERLGLSINREELLKQLIKDAKVIDVED